MANNQINITLNVGAQIASAQSKIDQLAKSLKQMGDNNSFTRGLTGNLNELSAKFEALQKRMAQPVTSKADFNNVTKEFNQVIGEAEALKAKILDLQNLTNQDLFKKVTSNDFRSTLKNTGKDIDNLKNKYSELTKEVENYTNGLRSAEKQQSIYKGQLTSLRKNSNGRANVTIGKETIRGNVSDEYAKVTNNDISNAQKEIVRLNKDIGEASGEELKGLIKDLTIAKQKYADLIVTQKALEIQEKQTNLTNLTNQLNNLNTTQLKQVKAQLEQLGIDATNLNIDNLDKFQEVLDNLQPEKANEARQVIVQAANNFREFGQATQEAGSRIKDTGDQIDVLDSRLGELNSIQSRITNFLGLANTLDLFKRAVRQAIEVIKDLDAVMTETAVVTDYTVGDMWNKLQDYTDRANQLGATIHDVYEADTLFYQQGLKTNEVVEVSTETLKMARIAGLDAADATDRMTNALRGFNMEINEANAANINDVYSALAAKTASNVDEISTAMTKVASLANNANMSFENTAAFLSQIIETTRESAETAGTALKTVVARFSEVKKLYSEGQLIGADEEGEEIQVNKVGEALASANINLNEYLTGMKGLDEIFIELASKWDSLDIVQQRYIATMAAGSRQQSRFIALMSDYARTQELTGIATNASGQSQKQFEKTLDSLEAHLNKLHNAWNTFLMTISNSEIIKGAVSLLTNLINMVNKLTTKLGAFGGVVNIALSFGALRGAKGLVTAFFRSFLKDITLADAATKTKGSNIISFITKLPQVFKQANDGTNIKGIVEALEGATKNTKDYGKAVIDLKNAYGLNREQLKASIALMDKGVSADVAAAGAKAGLTAETLTLTGATDEEKNEEVLRQIAQQKGIDLDNMSFLQKAKLILTAKLGTKAKQAETVALLQEAGATHAAAIANFIFQLSLWQIALILVILTAAIIGIVALVKFLYNNSLEGKIEATRKELEQTNKALQESQQALDDINSSREELEGMQDDLENLTRGTQEWKQKLFEVNQEIIDLINKYPELAKFIKRGNSGQLTISDEGWDELVEKQQQGVAALQVSSLASNAKLSDLQYQKDRINWYSDLGESIQKNFLSYKVESTDITGRQLEDFASDLYSKGILDPLSDEAKEIFEESFAGANWEYMSKVIKDMGDGFFDIVTYAEENRNESEVQNRATVETIVNSAEEAATSKFADTITELLASTNDVSESIQAQADEMTISGDELKKSYADLLEGVFYNNGKLYRDSAFTDEITDLDESTMKMVLASEKVADNLEDSANKLSNVLDRMNSYSSSGTLAFSNVLKGGSDLTSEQLNEIVKSGDIANYLKELGYNSIDKLAEDLGMSIEELTEKLQQGFENAIENLKKQKATTVAQVAGIVQESGESVIDAAGEAGKRIANLNKTYGAMIDDYMFNMQNQLSNKSGGNSDFVRRAYSGYLDIIENTKVSRQELDRMQKIIDNIDLTNVVDSAQALNTELRTGSETTKQFAQYLLDAGNDLFDISAQFQSIFDSEDWKALDKKIGKIITKQGKLAASDITGLTSDFSELSEMLEQTGITAGGAAEAISAIYDGTIDADDLTDTVLASLKAFDSLNSTVSTTLEMLQQFSYDSLDEKKVAGSIADWAEAVQGNIDIGAWGNSINSSLIDEFLGAGFSTKYSGDTYKDLVRVLNTFLEENKNGMISAWKELANGETILGGSANTQALGTLKIESTSEGGISISGYEGMTTDEMVQKIATAYGVTTDVAKMMVTDFKNYSAELSAALSENDMLSGIKESIEEIYEDYKSIANKSWAPDPIVTKQELETIAQLYNTTVEEIEGYYKANGIKIVDWFNTDGVENDLDHIKDAFEDMFEDWDGWWHKFVDNSTFDLASMEKALKSMGFTDSQIQSLTDEVYQSIKNGGRDGINTVVATLSDGVAYSFSPNDNSELGNDVQELKENMEAAAKNQVAIFADGIATAFKNIKIIIQGKTVATFDTSGVSKETNGLKVASQTKMSKNKSTQYTVPEVKIETPKVSSYGTISGYEDWAPPKEDDSSKNKDKTNEEDFWKPDYDKLYNLLRDIEQNTRKQEVLSKLYNLYNKNSKADASTLERIRYEQLKTIGNDYDLNMQKLNAARQQMADTLATYQDYLQYATFNWQDNTIEIDYDRIMSQSGVMSEEEGQRIDDLISKMEDIKGKIDEADDALYATLETLQSIRDEAIEDVIDYQNKVREALVAYREEQINVLKDINTTIKDSNKRILDDMKKSITNYRQGRDNAQKETDLNKLAARIGYLGQDTSGGHQVEILDLQEQLRKDSMSYTDTLIDQKISELEQQNDKAYEQRERQIEVAETQLTLAQKTGLIWGDVQKIMDKSIGPSGEIIKGTPMEKIMKRKDAWNAMGDIEKEKWANDLQSETEAFVANTKTLKNWDHTVTELQLPDDVGTFTGTMREIYNRIPDGIPGQLEALKQAIESIDGGDTYQYFNGGDNGGDNSDLETETSQTRVSYDTSKSMSARRKYTADLNGYRIGTYSSESAANEAIDNWIIRINNLSKHSEGRNYSDVINQLAKMLKTDYATAGKLLQAAANNYFARRVSEVRYASGGLADFTGPAWLDGSKSKPELVLNAQDTQNFLALKDLLSDMQVNSGNYQTSQDAYFNIDINVDSISSDYDVDKMIQEMQRMIVQSAQYRNVNTVNNIS